MREDPARERLRRLFAAHPEDFTRLRGEAQRELRAVGAKEAAARLGKARRPPLRLWAANRAVSGRPDAAERLAGATAELHEVERAAAAGATGAGARLRQAAGEQRRQLDVLEAEARSALAEISAAPAAAAEARDLIRAAVVAGGEPWRDLLDGVLEGAPPPAESVFGLPAAELPEPAARPDPAAERRRDEQAMEGARRARELADRLDAEAEELESRAAEARRKADAAGAAATAAERLLRPGSRRR